MGAKISNFPETRLLFCIKNYVICLKLLNSVCLVTGKPLNPGGARDVLRQVLPLAPHLSPYRFSVATTQSLFHEKTWNEPIFVVPLHRQSGQTSTERHNENQSTSVLTNKKFKEREKDYGKDTSDIEGRRLQGP